MSNVKKYTPEQAAKIKAWINKELDEAFRINAFGKGTPIWMSILFMLQKFNTGKYYGTLELKILGMSVNDVKEKEVTYKLQERYNEP